MKPKTRLFHAVEQLAHILDKEPTKTLIKVVYDNEQLVDALMKSSVKNRVSLRLGNKVRILISPSTKADSVFN
jgi:hypothetical protein